MAVARYKYESNAGNVFYARTDSDSELAAVRGVEPTANNTEYLTFRVSKNAGESGCRPRTAVLVRLITNPTAGDSCVDNDGSRKKEVVVLTKAHYDSLAVGTAVTVNGESYKVSGKRQEVMR